jgi:hypothetical protein
MIINYQGADYDLDQEHVTVDQWRELKRKYKMTPKQFQDAIDEADPDASTFLYWVMLHQNGAGNGQPLGDNLKPDILALNQGLAKALAAEAERQLAEAAEDPTPGGSRPDGTTPQPTGSSTTSTPSATSTSPPSAGTSASGRGTSDG